MYQGAEKKKMRREGKQFWSSLLRPMSVLTWTCVHISALVLLVFIDVIAERNRKMNSEPLRAILVRSLKRARQCRGVTSPNLLVQLLMK